MTLISENSNTFFLPKCKGMLFRQYGCMSNLSSSPILEGRGVGKKRKRKQEHRKLKLKEQNKG